MDLSKKTDEEDSNRVDLGPEYPVNIFKKRKTFLSHINAFDELPSGQKERTNAVLLANDKSYSSAPLFERGGTSNPDNFSQSCIPTTESSKNSIVTPNRSSSKSITCRTGIWAAALPSDTESTPSEKGEDDQEIDPLNMGSDKDRQTQDSKEKEEQCAIDKAKEDKQCLLVKDIGNEGERDDLLFDEVTRDFIYSVSSSSSSDGDSDAGNEWFPCSICKKVFFSRKAFTNHRRSCFVERDQNCPYCGKAFKRMSSVKNHILAAHSNDRPFLCDICGITYPHNKALRRHLATHDSKLKTHMCEICGKSFYHPSNLKSHSVIHSEEMPFKCEQCGQKFRRIFTLRSHLKTHTNERPYKCECGKSFTQSSSLKTHQKLHSGERPHVCNVCNKGFVLKPALQLHMRTHTKERPFKCEMCDKSFSQSSTLKIHLKSHENDKTRQKVCNSKEPVQEDEAPTEGETKAHHCELCGRFFAAKQTLKVHLMRHRGERPHKCSECSKSFTQSSTLKIHMRTHTGDKPYSCDVCDAHFTYSYALQKHYIKHQEAGEVKDENQGCNESSEPDKSDSVKLSAVGEDVTDSATFEEMKHTILQTLCSNNDDLAEKSGCNESILESKKIASEDESNSKSTCAVAVGDVNERNLGDKVMPQNSEMANQSLFKSSLTD